MRSTIRRLGYAALTVLLLALIGVFVARTWRSDRPELPSVEAPPEMAGWSCDDGLLTARGLTRSGKLEEARRAYLWLIERCEASSVEPDALLEAGSLLGHLMDRPAEARAAYEMFLQRFPIHPDVPDALYHLARLEIDAGDYPAAVAHLTALADRYPDDPHQESARFLAEEAAGLLAADRRSQRTLGGQLAALVPNNLASVLVLLLAMAPSVIQTVRQARRDAAGGSVRWPWVIPLVVIGLTLCNSVLNNVDNARRNKLVMDKLDRLLESQAHKAGSG